MSLVKKHPDNSYQFLRVSSPELPIPPNISYQSLLIWLPIPPNIVTNHS